MKSSQSHETSCLIIGSGAGGLTTAITLARAGHRVTIVEEGFDKSTAAPFSLEELQRDYRSGGQILTLGPRPINLGEGRLLGGGTAINTGYYLRPTAEKLESLATSWRINELTEGHLKEDFDVLESELKPQYQDEAGGFSENDWMRATQACQLKAEKARFVHHWNSFSHKLERRSLFDLWKHELASLGVTIIPGCKIQRLKYERHKWRLQGRQGTQEKNFESPYVFLCAGAIESAHLLRRSGITQNIGNNLRFHLFVRMMARFKQKINPQRCPLYSWKSSNELLTVGHSPDYPHLMALAFPEMLEEIKLNWEHWSSFYASISTTHGRRIRAAFGSEQPFIFSYLTSEEKSHLTQAFSLLQSFLKELGAQQTHPQSLAFKFLQSVHLFGSCPMGEDEKRCATNSWGQVKGHNGLYVNDASLIGSSIGQNPQATIMAIARRNSRHFLSETHS